MSLLQSLRLEAIDEKALRGLVDAAAPESQHLEFKEDGFQTHRTERLPKSVAAMANAGGGDIVLGMATRRADADAAPVPDLVGLDGNPDALLNALRQTAQAQIDPVVLGLDMRAVPLGSGRFAVVVRVPASLDAPHQQRSNMRFPLRLGAVTVDATVDQLRTIFGARAAIEREIAAFVAARRKALTDARPKLIVHLVPYAAFAQRPRIDLEGARQATRGLLLGPVSSLSQRTVQGGLLAFQGGDPKDTAATRALVRRDGIIESSTGEAVQDPATFGAKGRTLSAIWVEESLYEFLDHALAFLQEREILPPYELHLALTGTYGAVLLYDQLDHMRRDPARDGVLDHVVALEPLTIAAVPPYDDGERRHDPKALWALLRPLLDELANAGNVAGSPRLKKLLDN